MKRYLPNTMKAKIASFWEDSDSFRAALENAGYEIPEDEVWLTRLLSGEVMPLNPLAAMMPEINISCRETEDDYTFWVDKISFPVIDEDSIEFADSISYYVNTQFARAAKLCTFINQYRLWKD